MKLNASFYIRSFLPLIVLGASVILFYFLAIVPQLNRIEEHKAELEQINNDIEEARGILASKPEMEEEIKTLEQKNQKLTRKIPEKSNIPAIVREVSENLNRSGVRVISLSPEEGADKVSVNLNLRTDFINFGEIMRGVESSDMLFVVSELDLRDLGSDGRLDVRMVLTSFFRE